MFRSFNRDVQIRCLLRNPEWPSVVRLVVPSKEFLRQIAPERGLAV
jgi:hypothetical protein